MARDYDWCHKRYVGDVDAAKAAEPEARKFLGFVKSEAKRLNLPTYQLSRRLNSGVEIVAEIIGEIPRITIIAPIKPPEKPKQPGLEGFVVRARTEELPDGIGPDFPQQLLAEIEGGWKTRTKNSAITPGRSDGTYGARFPDGLKHAGNTDWLGASGERISWYGPSSRAFMDGYINPSQMFGKFVFMLGQVLLDIEAYINDNDDPFDDQFVVGAAIRRIGGNTYLYVVQSPGDDGETDSTLIPNGEGRYTYPLAPQTVLGGVHRYRLSSSIDPAGVKRYSVVDGSHEKLIDVQLGNADPWFFNESATVLTCHSALPPVTGSTPWWGAQLFDPVDPPDGVDDVEEYLPAEAQTRTRLAVLEAGIGLIDQINFSVTPGGPSVPITTDYIHDTANAYSLRLDENVVPFFHFDGVEVPLWQVAADGPDLHGVKRWILYANPRDRVVVLFLHDIRWVDDSPETPANTLRGLGGAIEIYRAGVLVKRTILYTPSAIPAHGFNRNYKVNSYALGGLVGQNITPAFFLYGVNLLVENTSPEGGSGPTSYRSTENFIGAVSTFGLWSYPAAAWFGTYDRVQEAGDPSRPPTPISTLVPDAFSGNREDDDGHFSVLGCGASERSIVLSCAVPTGSYVDSFHYVTDDTLPNLTGITGSGERYHPVWVLGRPPE